MRIQSYISLDKLNLIMLLREIFKKHYIFEAGKGKIKME